MSVVVRIGNQDFSEEDLPPLLAQYLLLPQLAKEMVIDQAIADIECTPEEAALCKQQFSQKYQLGTDEHIQAWQKHHGMTAPQLDSFMVRNLKIEKFKQLTWGEQVEPHFLKSKGQLAQVIYSLIRTKEAGVAQELYFRLQEGEDSFPELARRYSQGSEAQTGGLIGPVEINVPHPKISHILSTTQPGKVSPPVQVGDWWIILRLEKYISAELTESMRQRLLNELFQGWLLKQIQQNVSFFPSNEPNS